MRVRLPHLQKLLPYLRKKPVLGAIAGTLIIAVSFTGYVVTHRSQQHAAGKPAAAIPKAVKIPAEQLKHLEKATEGDCKGLYKIALPEQSQAKTKEDACTHGPDMAASINPDGSEVTGNYSVPCYGDGTSGKRVQAIYAVAKDKPDRYDEVAPKIRNWAGYMDAMLNKSAEKTGGQSHIKWVTGQGCTLDVAKVFLSPAGADSAGYTDLDIQAAGFNSSERVYIVWVDETKYCGLALFRKDDRHDPYVNFSDLGRSYSRIDSPCWGKTSSVELHELLHNLGAVQHSTPHASGFGHCTDEHDVMCYDDGSPLPMTEVCPADQEPLLDCGNDDYFHSHPESGSYLDTHWNVYNSSFLYSKVPTNQVAPSVPTNLVGTATSKGIQLNWQPSTDDEGKPVTYKVFRSINDGRADILATTAAHTYIDAAATNPGTTYTYFVAAFDPDNNGSAQSNKVTIKIPATPLPNPDTTPPPILSGLSASNIGIYGFTLSWNMPADKSDIKEIVLLLNGATWVTLTNNPSSYTHCCTLSPDTSYAVRIKTVDAAGNYSLGSQTTVKTLPVPPATPASNVPYDLAVSGINGAEVTLTATVATTSGASIYRVTPVGSGSPIAADWFLIPSTTPQVRTFVHPQVRPQNVTGFYIAVINSSGQETGRSATLAFSYNGSSETNPPATPAGFSISTSGGSPVAVWNASSDDSGKVYTYHRTLTDNVTNTTSTLTSGYSTSAGLGSRVSGRSYTLRVKAEDIWSNQSSEGVYTFTFP